jgi:glycosyltransferase involved in cell wall biosynthesis
MIRTAFAIPGDINLPTGGYAYDRRVLALLPRLGVDVQHLELPASFPDPGAVDLETTAARLEAVDAGTVLMIDGLAYGAMPAAVIRRARSPIIALVHHPLCLEAGLARERQLLLRDLETAALALATRIVVTSPATARTLAVDFAVSREKITIAEPGTDPATRAEGGVSGPLHFLSVGAVVPRKAYDILVRALTALPRSDWRLTLAGPTDRSAQALADLHKAVKEASLGDRITLAGPVSQERLAGLYSSADAFLLPSLYEGYGMVLAEAMARGLPIVCTTGGAAAETVPDAAAIKVPPGDVPALAAAIGRLVEDADLRRRMANASWAAGQRLPRWEETARTIAGVIASVAREGAE